MSKRLTALACALCAAAGAGCGGSTPSAHDAAAPPVDSGADAGMLDSGSDASDAASAIDARADDAGIAPAHDAGPAGTSIGGCRVGGTTQVMLDVHVVLAPEPVTDAASVAVHFESPSSTLDATTDASGIASVTLDCAMGPWTLTAARAGYSAVSIVGVSEIAFDGDVRLDLPLPVATGTARSVAGTVAGVATGRVMVDGYDLVTVFGPAGPWMTTFYEDGRAVPLRLVVMDYGPDATNFAVGPTMTPPSGDLTGITLTLPTPAARPIETDLTVHLPSTGLTVGSAIGGEPHVFHVLPMENDPYVTVGTIRMTGDTSFHVVSFAELPPNSITMSFHNSAFTTNVMVHDATTTDVTVGAVDMLSVSGTSLADVVMTASGSGWDVASFRFGEDLTQAAYWRVFVPQYPGCPTSVSMPHLPSSVTLADIGGVDPNTLAMVERMDDGRAWSAHASNVMTRSQAVTVGGQYVSIAATGR